MSTLGDVKDLSSTAAVMLKTSVFAAWAEFQAASLRQAYLAEVIRPHLPLLAPLWIASLREYARVRVDPEAGMPGSGALSGASSFESTYAGLTREVALPYYATAWPPMLMAVALLLKTGDCSIILAMDGIEPLSPEQPTTKNGDDEPAMFFYVVFGLAFEALSNPSASISGGVITTEEGRALTAKVLQASLEALGGLIRPEVAGKALFRDSMLEELCALCQRLIATEPPAVQRHVIGVVVRLATSYADDLLGEPMCVRQMWL